MGVVVIKIGGEIIDNEERFGLFADECAALCQRTDCTPIIVHGGGKQISEISARLGLTPQFVNGLRITSAFEMPIVQMVLAGSVNSIVVRALCKRGLVATGISGISGGLLRAEPMGGGWRGVGGVVIDERAAAEIDGDFTASTATCSPKLLRLLLSAGYTPVVAPIGLGPDGYEAYNVNADTAAAAIACALEAELLFVTDVPGVLDADGALIPRIERADYQRLIAEGVVRGGMRAKLAACFADTNSYGVKKAVIGIVQQSGDMLSLINHTQGTIVWNDSER